MLESRLANMLLFVPYNREYNVSTEVKYKLTDQEFFSRCYYTPDFDKMISILLNLNEEDSNDLGYPINQAEMIRRIQQQKRNQNSIMNWLNNNGIGVYAISGEAGTGKTTYLRHLAYEMDEYHWCFLDMANGIERVRILNWKVEVPEFSSLKGKVLSVLMQKIASFYVAGAYNKENTANQKVKNCNNIQQFSENILSYAPSHELCDLYSEFAKIDTQENDRHYNQLYANVLLSFFNELIKMNNSSYMLELLLELLQIILFIYDNEKKHIVIFDNIERYIGTDEIYDNQIVDFMRVMRRFSDQYNNQYGEEYAAHFQFIISLRDTTLRVFTPQQIADFLPHNLDLSEWFPIDEIVNLRIQWYEQHEELLTKNDKLTLKQLQRILSDQGQTGQIMRGLRLKLSMLFNNNKRLLLDYLVPLLENEDNIAYLRKADEIWNNENIHNPYRKFAYRSIIWRIVCDRLKRDALFESLTTVALDGTFDNIVAALNYIRKILTILSNANSVEHDKAVSLNELLRRLYKRSSDMEYWFFDDQWKQERQKIAYCLYILNYCNRHENHWFRFINIICRNDLINKKHIFSSRNFEEYMLQKGIVNDITLQITSAGIGYLGYIVQSFEQISSLFYNNPPLLATIPTEQELIKTPLEDLLCVQIVKKVGERSLEIRRNLSQKPASDFEIDYVRINGTPSISYVQRIENAHLGYIGNFREIIYEFFAPYSSEVREKAAALSKNLRSKANRYYYNERNV